MSANANPLEYWTPAAPPAPQLVAQGQAPASMFTGPDRVGCSTMLVIVALASGLAMGIVAALAWALA